jgi:hypothetical protein
MFYQAKQKTNMAEARHIGSDMHASRVKAHEIFLDRYYRMAGRQPIPRLGLGINRAPSRHANMGDVSRVRTN